MNGSIRIINLRDYAPCQGEVLIKIDRSSVLGNPFRMNGSSDAERDRVCDAYESYIREQIKSNKAICDELNRIWLLVKQGHNVALGCWCAPKRCHGESIKRLIESALDSSASIVFMGGSISIKALPDDKDLLLAIDNAARSAHIVIGDAPGADAAIQGYLYKHGYRNVTVYYRGSQSAPRNNIGGWKAIAYGSSFVDKDIEMSRVCGSGLFLWDSRSKGTKGNIDRLHQMGKAVLVYDKHAIIPA